MFRMGEENPWLCQLNTDPNADFCVWVLEVDGLHVPPFDHHAEGDGTLRAAGLDAESWRAWMKEVISTNDRSQYNVQRNSIQLINDTWKEIQAKGLLPADPQSDEFQKIMHSDESQKIMQDHLQQVSKARQARPDLYWPKHTPPLDAWHGNAAVSKRLGELREQYNAISNTRYQWRGIFQGGAEGNRNNLWQDLAPYHTRLDGLFIRFVEYSQPIAYPVPPFSAIITIVNRQLDYKDLLARALQVAEALATSI